MQLLRIVAADIAGALPLMKVSDHLTWLAEAITEEGQSGMGPDERTLHECHPRWR